MGELKINHLAVWLCVILGMVLGFLWYGPLFGETWMDLENLEMATVEANPPGAGTWITNTISIIAPVYLLAWMFTKMNIDNAIKGALLALLIGVCFNLLNRMTNDMFAMNPYGLSWIVGGYTVVFLTISGLILGAWRKYN